MNFPFPIGEAVQTLSLQCKDREFLQNFDVVPTQDGRRVTRGAALIVDLSWTSSTHWECGLVMDLFKTLLALPLHTSSGLPRNW